MTKKTGLSGMSEMHGMHGIYRMSVTHEISGITCNAWNALKDWKR